MLPVTCRSADRTEAGGFALGALALNSFGFCGGIEGALAAVDAVVDVLGVSAPLAAGSLILLLENIVCCLDIDHWIDGFTTDAHFVM